MRLKRTNALLCSFALHAVVVAVAAVLWRPAPAGGGGGACSLCVHVVFPEMTSLLDEEPNAERTLEPEREFPEEREFEPGGTQVAAPSAAIADMVPASIAAERSPMVVEALPVPVAKGRAVARIPARPAVRAGTGGRVKAGAASAATIPPRLTFAAPPEYPDAVEARGIGGSVVVTFTVDTRGRVAGARVARSSGEASLDGSALAAVRRYRFSPALAEGRPVEWAVEKRITFRPARG
jgi:protein TonB